MILKHWYVSLLLFWHLPSKFSSSALYFVPNSSEISNFLTLGLQDAKICFSDDTLPDGFSVRKGDMVSYQPYAMGRMRFVWGDDAEEFRPERWLNEKGLFCPESPFKFTAFQVRFYIPLLHASNSPSPHISLLFCSTLLHGKCIKEKTFFKFSNSYPCPKRDMRNITKFMLMKKAKISFCWLTGRPENLFGKGVCL